jgi:hypothetical protein
MKTLKTATLALVATLATAIVLPAIARAEYRAFQSPSGNILCLLAGSGVTCDVSDHTYQLPPGPLCSQHIQWGDRFKLQQGDAVGMPCHADTLPQPGNQILDYGQTISTATITCESQPSGITCTDGSTGHYFRVSRDSYDLG